MHFRLPEYLIGVLTGYALYTNALEKLKSQRFIQLVFWVLSLGFLYFHIIESMFFEMSVIHRLYYTTFERELFCLSVCWIVFATHRFKPKIIDRFLSHEVWQPLSKLSLR
jgi:hypothetical protein